MFLHYFLLAKLATRNIRLSSFCLSLVRSLTSLLSFALIFGSISYDSCRIFFFFFNFFDFLKILMTLLDKNNEAMFNLSFEAIFGKGIFSIIDQCFPKRRGFFMARQ